MGLFLAATALRERSVNDVVETVRAYASKLGSAADVVFDDSTDAWDVLIYTPRAAPSARVRWTCVIWPDGLVAHHLPLCLDASKQLDTAACSAHIHEGDYWANFVCDKGKLVDRFASWPDYHAPDRAAELKAKYRGDATRVASVLGCDPTLIASYLEHPDPDAESGPGKVMPDDEFELFDVWVFTDLWRRLGIVYPRPQERCARRLRLHADCLRTFPRNDEDL